MTAGQFVDMWRQKWSGSAAPQAAAGPRAVPGDAPQKFRPATREEKLAHGVSVDVPAQVGPDGKFDVISGTAATLKPVPVKIQDGVRGNMAAIKQIDETIKELQRNPNAMGLLNKLGENVRQRLDPNGIEARAGVANIGSLILHDRSGAAVTAAETPRLLPFIPTTTDTATAAIKKLQALKHQYENENEATSFQFGEDSGYRPMGGTAAAARTAPKVKTSGAGWKIVD
jgi:hypothetical protein